ncbi:hypothetical protein BGX28_006769 [Mortierella sp. GBA30]|nr:hypothetical protein BGX28_006769 [Mortierella sp. GBA30]
MDIKKIHPTEPHWDNQTEQEIFGTQAPYATDSGSNDEYFPASVENTPPFYQAHPYRPDITSFTPPPLPENPNSKNLNGREMAFGKYINSPLPYSPLAFQQPPASYGTIPGQTARVHDGHNGTAHGGLEREQPIYKRDACAMTSDRFMYKEFGTYIALNDMDLTVKILDGIVGNIVITERESWERDELIDVKFTRRSSSAEILDIMSCTSSIVGTIRTEFSLSMNPGDMGKLRGHCTKVDIEINMPKAEPYPHLLKVETTVGIVQFRMDSAMAVLENVTVDVGFGSISVMKASVGKRAEFKVSKGNVQGTLSSSGEVSVEVIDGNIGMALDTFGRTLDGISDSLNATLNCKKGSINLALAQRYQGHFSLNSGNQKPTFHASDAYPAIVKYSNDTEGRLEGWITKSGREPVAALPRLLLSSEAGPTAVIIEDPR